MRAGVKDGRRVIAEETDDATQAEGTSNDNDRDGDARGSDMWPK
jgi:hypothetical protein